MKPTPKTRGILHKFLSENGRKGGSNFSEKKQAQFANLQKIRMANIAKKAILIGENHRKINLQKNED